MKLSRFQYLLLLIAFLAFPAWSASAQSSITALDAAQAVDQGRWETVYVERGAMGEIGTGDAVSRSLFTMPVNGTKVRLYINQSPSCNLLISRITLVRGADANGTILPPVYTINFKGSPSLQIPPWLGEAREKLHLPKTGPPPNLISDDMLIPVTAGFWYLQESYEKGSKIPYNYSVDGGFRAASHEASSVSSKDARAQDTWRIDVWTRDVRPLIACYGDSITQGYGSTPLSGNRFPDLLGKALDQPVLNLGVNGDNFESQYSYAAVEHIQDLANVEIVVFLLGVNDIIGGTVKTVADYSKCATRLVDGFHNSGKKVIWGTISPGTGYKAFSDDPAHEVLRQAINQWIRGNAFNADGIVDYDAALADPRDPKLLTAAWQKDWLHPNDAGNQVMAKVAAAAVRKVEAGMASGAK
jgi:lysophospholipase L1-like esterase